VVQSSTHNANSEYIFQENQNIRKTTLPSLNFWRVKEDVQWVYAISFQGTSIYSRVTRVRSSIILVSYSRKVSRSERTYSTNITGTGTKEILLVLCQLFRYNKSLAPYCFTEWKIRE